MHSVQVQVSLILQVSMTLAVNAELPSLAMQFVNRIVVGPRPVHLYVIDEINEFWSHSDAEGLFYAIPVRQPTSSMVSAPLAVSWNALQTCRH